MQPLATATGRPNLSPSINTSFSLDSKDVIKLVNISRNKGYRRVLLSIDKSVLDYPSFFVWLVKQFITPSRFLGVPFSPTDHAVPSLTILNLTLTVTQARWTLEDLLCHLLWLVTSPPLQNARVISVFCFELWTQLTQQLAAASSS